MTERIETDRCTNTVARAFGIEADHTLVFKIDLDRVLNREYDTVKIDVKLEWNEDTYTTKRDTINTIVKRDWQNRPDNTLGMVIFTKGHVQAIFPNGTKNGRIVDTYTTSNRGFYSRRVNAAYYVVPSASGVKYNNPNLLTLSN